MKRFDIRALLGPALLGVIGATLIAGASGSNAWAADTARRQETWNWSGTLAAGRKLEIHGVNGEIVAEPGTGDRVEVVADKHSRKHDPALVRIKVVQDSDGITICAIYPGKGSPCEPAHFSLSDKADDVQVDFHVKLPAAARFEADNVNGAVRVHGLTGPLRARTVNGACEIETSGPSDVSTVNGAVNATLTRIPTGDDNEFKTVNGGIRLALPEGANAEFHASTVNGSISSDFPVTMSGQWGPHSAHGTLGRGGPRLAVSTVNGGIRVVRSGVQ